MVALLLWGVPLQGLLVALIPTSATGEKSGTDWAALPYGQAVKNAPDSYLMVGWRQQRA